jgi:hypothetical protein
VTVAVFLLGMMLLAFGARSDALLDIFGESHPVFALVRGVGLLAVLGSIITGLALYGSALPLTRSEREGGLGRRAQHPLDGQEVVHGGAAEVKFPLPTPRGTTPLAIRLIRSDTEARLRIAVERKQHKSDKTEKNETSHVA